VIVDKKRPLNPFLKAHGEIERVVLWQGLGWTKKAHCRATST